MSRKIRVIVVDDSALVRSLLSEIINRQRDMECIGTANDPLVAREMIRELNPDVITLDVEMPRMDGIDFLGRLMRLRPMPVVMISTLTERGAEVTMNQVHAAERRRMALEPAQRPFERGARAAITVEPAAQGSDGENTRREARRQKGRLINRPL